MKFGRRKKESHSRVPSVQTVTRKQQSNIFGLGRLECQTKTERELYRSLREGVPIIDASICKIVRLIGKFTVETEDKRCQSIAEKFIEEVHTNGCGQGLNGFIYTYLDTLITYGEAVGEMVPDADCNGIYALYNASLDDVVITADRTPLELLVCRNECGVVTPVKYRDRVFATLINPKPGTIKGSSILSGLPFVSSILLRILESIKTNWERLGDIRFAVTYNPDIILALDSGIVKEVSVGCAVEQVLCSICGEDISLCAHKKGEMYSSKLCCGELLKPYDAYEFSFVAVPAQKRAGVTKNLDFYGKEMSMDKILNSIESKKGFTLDDAQCEKLNSYIEGLRQSAKDGVYYRECLTGEVLRLSAVVQPDISRDTMESIAKSMTLAQLKEFRNAFMKNKNEKFSPCVQLYCDKGKGDEYAARVEIRVYAPADENGNGLSEVTSELLTGLKRADAEKVITEAGATSIQFDPDLNAIYRTIEFELEFCLCEEV